jgi:hypothetical protein
MQKRCIATITANGAWTRYWHCGFMCEFIMVTYSKSGSLWIWLFHLYVIHIWCITLEK